ncbi:ubiquinone biosynthesis O-methyltransferase, mitochondrial-like isoform X1 [Leguminivora glycinivorella]|uniref:ubiquinone biosynthesis O-methyltransferase, mitochondrial-like isoform X1 n=1 Tax=Leguminivora glycinivorella TaxID=1035111 RepID=UPI00200CD937|nr:ubiquinone biosynthesis O-methyltransferase, mitochondrial-like isoform X1 [Leguminivora glycinivorella]
MTSLQFRASKHMFCSLSLMSPKTRTFGCSTSLAKKEGENISTVDVRDVKQHSKLRDQWWDPIGPMIVLHRFNLIRVPFVRDGLAHSSHDHRNSTPLLEKKILDIGCGGGILTMPLAKLGAEMTGVDASQELISVAQEYSQVHPPVPGKQPTYICTSIEEHAKDHANVYDGVVASEIIEHIENDKKELFVKSCINTLKPGGRIFFTTPTRTRLSQFTTICLAEYVLNTIPRGTHQYDQFTTPKDLTLLLERNGCRVEAVQGCVFNFFQKKWHIVSPTTFFFFLQAIKPEEKALPR